MAFSPGYDAIVKFNNTDISQYVKSVKSNPARKDYPLPVLGGNAVKRMVGPVATEYDIEMFLDPTVVTLFNAEITQATPTTVTFVYQPQGATGSTETSNVFVLNFPKSTPSEGAAEATVKLVTDGAVTYT